MQSDIDMKDKDAHLNSSRPDEYDCAYVASLIDAKYK